ncbi:MAG TPA: class I SAM-dependent methyltransferase, partial [Bryobacteraceae bacterium]|nr:class I SAM-dependent methyltransferase [Bryobacteraceae bacterium]
RVGGSAGVFSHTGRAGMRGTTPAGAATEREASEWVRGMFGRVARRYDLANHLLSFNLDRYWRARTVSRVGPWLRRPGARALDLCCGTGDLLLELEAGRGGPAWGSDFCHPMLTSAAEKIARRGFHSRVFEADALAIPARDAAFDLVTVAFGFRNLANYRKGLEEMRRVLRPGGAAAILEFSQPPNALLAALYGFYSRHVLPAVGGALSGSKDAYAYLPESVRKFPPPDELAGEMRAAGFRNVRFERITGGIVCLHLGEI